MVITKIVMGKFYKTQIELVIDLIKLIKGCSFITCFILRDLEASVHS